mgnify:CR=1 FL=1
MDFYRINEEYNRFLQRYEKEKRGITKVPNMRTVISSHLVLLCK